MRNRQNRREKKKQQSHLGAGRGVDETVTSTNNTPPEHRYNPAESKRDRQTRCKTGKGGVPNPRWRHKKTSGQLTCRLCRLCALSETTKKPTSGDALQSRSAITETVQLIVARVALLTRCRRSLC